MEPADFSHGLSTLLNHYTEGQNPLQAHLTPIYQTATFSFPDTATGQAIERGEQPGYIYSRGANPNADQFARKVAAMEGLDLLRARPQAAPEEMVTGRAFASGMAAITAAVLGRVHAGDTIIAQRALYGNAYNLLHDVLPRLGIQVTWVDDPSPEGWSRAMEDHPQASLLYAETPVNPSMLVVDLPALVELAHTTGAWLLVDNTFGTPYCQRPLSLGADIVVHSTTKYLSGHGAVIGGAVVSKHPDYIEAQVQELLELLGAAPSPFDAWLANLGLKTFELRMQRHCENALEVARFLEGHSGVARVFYPGLESDPGHEIAQRQMSCYGGMIAFALKGGFSAAERLLDSVRVATLAVSLGNLDTLVQHPASMTHSSVPADELALMGVTPGMIRLSVGIENVEDLLADFEQALGHVGEE